VRVVGKSVVEQIAGQSIWLKDNFTQPLRIDDLATQVNHEYITLPSSFPNIDGHDARCTYQKWLRFERQLRGDDMAHRKSDAATVAVQVGYEAPPKLP